MSVLLGQFLDTFAFQLLCKERFHAVLSAFICGHLVMPSKAINCYHCFGERGSCGSATGSDGITNFAIHTRGTTASETVSHVFL